MLRGDFRQFSVERLLRFLVALDQDVAIVVKPHHDRKNAPCKSCDAALQKEPASPHSTLSFRTGRKPGEEPVCRAALNLI